MSGTETPATPPTSTPSPSPPTATVPSPTPLPPIPSRKSHTGALIGGAVVIIVVLAVVGLGVAGVIPIPGLHSNGGGGGGSSPAGTPSTFATAWNQANQSAKAYGSGSWKTYLAAGISTPIASTQSTDSVNNLSSPGCTATPASGLPSSVHLPAANPTTGGLGSVWFFLYGNGSDLVLFLDNGASAIPALTLTGSCSTVYNSYFQPLSPSVLNSPQVTQAVRSNASAFLAANSNLTTSYAVIGGLSYLGLSIPSTWTLAYTTCGLTETAGSTGNTFNATLGSTTGVVSASSVVNDSPCSTSFGISPPSGLAPAITQTLTLLQAEAAALLE